MQDLTLIQWHNKIMQDEMHALQTEHVLFEELHAKMEIELHERMDEMDKTINDSYELYDERHDYHKLISGSDLVLKLPLSYHESSSLWFTNGKATVFHVNFSTMTFLSLFVKPLLCRCSTQTVKCDSRTHPASGSDKEAALFMSASLSLSYPIYVQSQKERG